MDTQTPHIAALSLVLDPAGGFVQLFPAGVFNAERGALRGQGPWQLTAEAARRLMTKAAARVNDIVIDYEHQTLLSADNGKPAPAAGWIKPNSLRYDEAKGLLAASVTWTEAAAAAIAADEYRYISPVFTYDGATGTVLDLIHVALTNQPAIDGMDAVTLAAAKRSLLQSSSTDEENPVAAITSTLKQMLGLAESATDEELNHAVAALKAKAGVIDAKDAEIAALKAQTPDPAQFAPVAVVTSMQSELAALKAKEVEREINDLIQPALADGRLLPGLEGWARDLGKNNLAALAQFVQTATPIAALSGMQTGGKAPDALPSGEALVAACKAEWEASASLRGEFATLEDYTAYKKAQAAGLIKIQGKS